MLLPSQVFVQQVISPLETVTEMRTPCQSSHTEAVEYMTVHSLYFLTIVLSLKAFFKYHLTVSLYLFKTP